MSTGYKITVVNKGVAPVSVRLNLPPVAGVRRLEKQFHITIEENGTVNVPATGDLCAHSDVPMFLKALRLAEDIATGRVVVEGMEVVEEEEILDPMAHLS